MNILRHRGSNESWLTVAVLWIIAIAATPAGFAQMAAPFVVTTLADSGRGSLRQAIVDANERPGADVIDFAPGLHGTILLTSGALRITDSLTIQGPGAFWLTVNGNHASRIFEVEGEGNIVSIDGLTITQGSAQGPVEPGMGGGILLVNSSLTLSRVLLSDNHAVGASQTPTSSSAPPNGLGGGVFNQSGNLHIVASTFINNQAVGGSGVPGGPAGGAGLGGGIDNEMGTLTLTDSTLVGNQAIGGDRGMAAGGGISSSGVLTVINSTFWGNRALGGSGGSAWGGGIVLQNLTTLVQSTIQDSAFVGNQAVGGSGGTGGAGEGGGIFAGGDNNLVVERAIFDDNRAIGGNGSNGGNGGNGQGGGLFNGGTLVINTSIVTRNSALGGTGGTGGDGAGGGIYNTGTLMLGPTTVVSGNFATNSPNLYPPPGVQ